MATSKFNLRFQIIFYLPGMVLKTLGKMTVTVDLFLKLLLHVFKLNAR